MTLAPARRAAPAAGGGRRFPPAELPARLLPAALTLLVLGLYLADGLAWHPGTTPAGCPAGVARLIHWDGTWYTVIAIHGYAPIAGSVQQATAFFPLLPWLANAVHTVVPVLDGAEAGVAVNVLALCVAMTLVDRLVAAWPLWQRAALVLLLLALPGAFFYAVFYSEALFALGVALVTWALATPGRLWWAPLGVAIAGADRVIGIALLLPLLVVLWQRRDQVSWRAAAAMVAGSLAGLVAVLVYGTKSAGTVVAFLQARSGWRGVGGVGYIPYTVKHGVGSLYRLVAEEAGASPVVSDGDPAIAGAVLPWSLGFYLDLLLVPLALAAWRWRHPVGLVAAVLVGVTLLVGPPISQMRFALVILPAWIGGVALLRTRRWGWPLLAVAGAAGLAANLVLMARFANCGWTG